MVGEGLGVLLEEKGGVGERRILLGRPPRPPNFQVQPAAQVGRSENLAPGRPVGKNQGRPTRHWLDPVRRQAASEGSLSLMVEGSYNADRSQGGGEGRVEHERLLKGGGGGSGRSSSRERGG